MKKQHDASSLANELEGASAFFGERQASPSTPTPASPPEKYPSPDHPATRPPDASTHRRADPSTDAPTGRRVDGATDRPAPHPEQGATPRRLQRRSFEFYLDQLETLKALSLEEQLRGEKGSMSEMIRAALDRYLRDEAKFHPSTDDPTNRPLDGSTHASER